MAIHKTSNFLLDLVMIPNCIFHEVIFFQKAFFPNGWIKTILRVP